MIPLPPLPFEQDFSHPNGRGLGDLSHPNRYVHSLGSLSLSIPNSDPERPPNQRASGEKIASAFPSTGGLRASVQDPAQAAYGFLLGPSVVFFEPFEPFPLFRVQYDDALSGTGKKDRIEFPEPMAKIREGKKRFGRDGAQGEALRGLNPDPGPSGEGNPLRIGG